MGTLLQHKFETGFLTNLLHGNLRKKINYNLCLSQCHWRHYKYPKPELIVPPMVLTEAQVVILLFLGSLVIIIIMTFDAVILPLIY